MKTLYALFTLGACAVDPSTALSQTCFTGDPGFLCNMECTPGRVETVHVPSPFYACQYPVQPWHLVFADEFNGNQLDNAKWTTYAPFTADGSDNGLSTRAPGGSASIYRDQNVLVQNGKLILRVREEDNTWFGVTRPYTSGMIYSRQPYHFRQGTKFEIRCKIPAGNRLWPAFWTWGNYSEIDFFEFCGQETSTIRTSVHRWDGEHRYTTLHPSTAFDWLAVQNYSEGYHTFSCEWLGNKLVFNVDGHFHNYLTLPRFLYPDPDDNTLLPWLGCQINQESPDPIAGQWLQLEGYPHPDDVMSLLVSIGVADDNHDGMCYAPGEIQWGPTADFEIDYVRVYQQYPQENLSDLCSSQFGIQSNPSVVCPDTQTPFTYFGPHGTLTWTCSPNLTITSQTESSVTVLSNIDNSDWGWIESHDSNPACPLQPATRHHEVWIGGPVIESTSYESVGCTDQVRVRVETLPYNNEERFYWLDNQFQYTNCLGQHYTYWHLTDEFIFCPPAADFCSELRIEVRSTCEDFPATSTLFTRDNCIIGPCDLIDPEISDKLSLEISVVPTPAVSSFDMVFSEKIDMRIIKEVFVWDASFTKQFTILHPKERILHVNCSAWPSGIYYATVEYGNEQLLSKIQIK